MKPNEPSRTALIIARQRAAHQVLDHGSILNEPFAMKCAKTKRTCCNLQAHIPWPASDVYSPPHEAGLLLLCLALLFHFGVPSRFTAADSNARSRRVNVIVACFSLAFWFGVAGPGARLLLFPERSNIPRKLCSGGIP